MLVPENRDAFRKRKMKASSDQVLCCLRSLLCAMLLAGCGKDDPKITEAAKPPSNVYEYGTKISFHSRGNAHRHVLTGWSYPEPHHTWTDGIGASLSFKVTRSSAPVVLKIKMSGFTVASKVPVQPVDVSVNNEKIGSWDVGPEQTYKIEIPARFVDLADPSLTIDFYIPKAASPAGMGGGLDFRRLGLCVQQLVISGAADPQEGDAVPARHPADRQ